jgi:tyrosyl-tRNA synthetase
MDSVAIRSDIELGGTDQKFNLLVGREIQREYGQEPQVILTMPILEGTDGVEKMSKSLDNYIAFNDTAEDIYGKVLSIPDALIIPYFRLATYTADDRLQEIEKELKSPDTNPRNLKRELARTVVAEFYNTEAATAAEEHFDRIHIEKGVPDEIPEKIIPVDMEYLLLDIIAEEGMVSSKGEGRRLMQQGGISIDGEKVSNPMTQIPKDGECVIKVGKRKFLKITRE